MATSPLTQAILQGMDPGTYKRLADLEQGNALLGVGMDASPTSKWGAIGRLANAAAGTYLTNSATSDLAKTIAGGKKSAQDQLLAAIESSTARPATVPMAAPAQAAPQASLPPIAPAVPAASPAPTAGSANAQVADRFPAEMSPPGTVPDSAPSPLDTAQWPAGPVGAPAAPGGDAVAAINGAIQPRGIRNNNPLNIEDGPFAKSQAGYAGSDGRFAKFQAPEHGAAAASALLDSYDRKHGLNTVAGIVNRWAPPSDGNNTMAYAADVAGKLGIDPNAPVPAAMRPQLIAAMAQHENGKVAPGTVQMASAAPQTMTDASEAAPARAGALDVHKLLAVLQNPYSDDATKSVASKLLLAQLTPSEDTYGVTGEGAFGDKKYGFINTKDHTINGQPADKAGGQAANSGAMEGIDSSKTGQEYLKQFPPEIQASVMDYLNGTKMPTGNPRRTDTVRQIASKVGAEIGLPADDAAFSERRKLRTDLGSSSANSLGGILSNGKSAFAHLSELSEKMAGLGNYNGPNIPGGAAIGAAGNFVGNTAAATPDTAAKLTGVNDNLLKYGQESTKFYAGTGGGEAERMNALKTMDPRTSSSMQQAEYLSTEKNLMLDRLAQKESQIKGTLGQEFLDKHPVRTPDLVAAIKKIDENIAKLKGEKPADEQAPATPAATATPGRSAIEAEMRKRGLLP